MSMDVRDSQLGQRFATQCGTGPYRHRGRYQGPWGLQSRRSEAHHTSCRGHHPPGLLSLFTLWGFRQRHLLLAQTVTWNPQPWKPASIGHVICGDEVTFASTTWRRFP